MRKENFHWKSVSALLRETEGGGIELVPGKIRVLGHLLHGVLQPQSQAQGHPKQAQRQLLHGQGLAHLPQGDSHEQQHGPVPPAAEEAVPPTRLQSRIRPKTARRVKSLRRLPLRQAAHRLT